MKFLLLAVLLTTLFSCGSTQKIDRNGIKQLKKIAVIGYTVPEYVEFREDPRENKKEVSLMDVAKAAVKEATKADGTKASSIAYHEFVKELNKKNLPFKIMSAKELKNNTKFAALVKTQEKSEKKKEKNKSGFAGFMSKVASITGDNNKVSKSPRCLKSFGLMKEWKKGNALIGSEDEKKYIKEAVAALGVDGILMINDPGFSFICKACVANTGVANTGSAFNATIVGKDGKTLLNLRQWFTITGATSAIVAGIVPPSSQNKLFKAHGVKMATVFSDEFKNALKEK